MKGMRALRRLRLRSPLWMAVLLLLLPYFPPLLHWVTSPWRPGWYQIPAEMVGDQGWVEGAPWPPDLKRDKVLVHNIWGSRIVDRSLFANTPINADLPVASGTVGVRPIFAGPSEWALELSDWNLQPLYFHRYSTNKSNELESITFEPIWLSTVTDESVLTDLGMDDLPWRDGGINKVDRYVWAMFRVLDPHSKPDFQKASIRDALRGQVVAESLPVEFIPALNPPRIYMLFPFKMDWQHRGPKVFCLERVNDRLVYKLDPELFGDEPTKVDQVPSDVGDASMPLRGARFVDRDELATTMGAGDGSIWGARMKPWLAPENVNAFTVRDALAQYFELSPEVEIVQSGDFIQTANVWSALKLENRKTANILQYIYNPRKQKKLIRVLWGLWVGWLILQFFFLRRFLRSRGFTEIKWLKTIPLHLEFGRSLRALPHAQEIAVIPGVDITSWRSLRRFVIEQAGRK